MSVNIENHILQIENIINEEEKRIQSLVSLFNQRLESNKCCLCGKKLGIKNKFQEKKQILCKNCTFRKGYRNYILFNLSYTTRKTDGYFSIKDHKCKDIIKTISDAKLMLKNHLVITILNNIMSYKYPCKVEVSSSSCRIYLYGDENTSKYIDFNDYHMKDLDYELLNSFRFLVLLCLDIIYPECKYFVQDEEYSDISFANTSHIINNRNSWI